MENSFERRNNHNQEFSSGRKCSAFQSTSPRSRNYFLRRDINYLKSQSQNEIQPTTNVVTFNTSKKKERSCNFFKNTRVDSCSHVQQRKSPDKNYVAVPYNVKPLKTYADNMQQSTYRESLNSFTYKQKIIPFAGMGLNKPLEKYSPKSPRNRLNTSNEFYIPANKTSSIEIGDKKRYSGDKHDIWRTTNMVEYQSNQHSSQFTNNSGIQIYRVKWDQYLKRKN